MSDDVAPTGRILFGENLVGFLMTWGSMEMAIDQVIAVTYRYHNAEAVVTRLTPVTIEKKLQFLTDAAAKIPSASPFSETIESLVSRVKAEKDLRNTLVHGWPLKVEKNGTAHIVRLRPRQHEPHYELRVVKDRDWDRLMTTCAEVFALATILTFGLSPEDVARNEVENVGRAWFVKGAETFPASKQIRKLMKELLSSAPDD